MDCIFELSLPSPNRRKARRERRHPIAEQSGLWQQPVVTVSHCRTSMTMAQRAPLAFPAIVPQEGWEEVQRPAAEPQPGTAKTVSLSADRLPAETARPPVSGELATFERCVRAESRPASRPGETPGPGRQRRPPGRAGAFGPVHRGLEHGRDRLRRPGQCPASEEPEFEYRVEALTGPAPRHQFHPGLPLQFAGPQDLAYVDEGLPVVQLQGVAYASGTHRYPGIARTAGVVDQSDGVGANSRRISPGHVPLDSSYRW